MDKFRSTGDFFLGGGGTPNFIQLHGFSLFQVEMMPSANFSHGMPWPGLVAAPGQTFHGGHVEEGLENSPFSSKLLTTKNFHLAQGFSSQPRLITDGQVISFI